MSYSIKIYKYEYPKPNNIINILEAETDSITRIVDSNIKPIKEASTRVDPLSIFNQGSYLYICYSNDKIVGIASVDKSSFAQVFDEGKLITDELIKYRCDKYKYIIDIHDKVSYYDEYKLTSDRTDRFDTAIMGESDEFVSIENIYDIDKDKTYRLSVSNEPANYVTIDNLMGDPNYEGVKTFMLDKIIEHLKKKDLKRVYVIPYVFYFSSISFHYTSDFYELMEKKPDAPNINPDVIYKYALKICEDMYKDLPDVNKHIQSYENCGFKTDDDYVKAIIFQKYRFDRFNMFVPIIFFNVMYYEL